MGSFRWRCLLGAALLFGATGCSRGDEAKGDDEAKPASSTDAAKSEAPSKKVRLAARSTAKKKIANVIVRFEDRGAEPNVSRGSTYVVNSVSVGSLELELSTSPGATIDVAGQTTTADDGGKAKLKLPWKLLFDHAKLEHADKGNPNLQLMNGSDHWVAQLPTKVTVDGATSEFDGHVYLTRALQENRRSRVRRGKGVILAGDPDPEGKPAAAMVKSFGRWRAFGEPETIYDVDVIAEVKAKKGRTKRCGPYGPERVSIELELGDVEVEAWDARTGKSLGTKTLPGKGACPQKIWEGTDKISKTAETYRAMKSPAVVSWLQSLI